MTSPAALAPSPYPALTAPRPTLWRARHRLVTGRRLAGAALILFVTGCASVVPRPLPPQADVSGVRLFAGGADDVRVRVLLDVRNPNPYAIVLVSVDARLAIETVPVATALLPAPVTLPAAGTAQVEVEARADLTALRQALPKVLRKRAAGYDVIGTAVVQDGLRLDFRKRGDLPLADLLGRLR